MDPMLNIAIRAAHKAGDIIMRSVDRIDELSITSKKRNDFVSEVDQQAEQVILAEIRKAYPDHGIVAEESGTVNEDSEYQWIIDPLDGTTNFLFGFPQFAVSIALQHKGMLKVGVVYDPWKQETFSAAKGSGAQLNRRRLRVTPRTGLEGALLGTGFPFRQQEHLDCYLDTFRALFPDTAGIRRAGSAALDLAYVAAGRLDGFWEIGLNDWDMAAGALIVREAGGIVTDFSGGEEYLSTGNIVAGSPKITHAILQTIKPHLTEPLKK